MYRNIGILLAGSALLLSSLACSVFNAVSEGWRPVTGNGNVVTEERDVSGFSAVDLGGIGNLEIEIGDQETLRIEAEENLLPYLEVEVRGDTLWIGIRENTNLNPTRGIHYYLTVRELSGVNVSGLGSITAPPLSASEFSTSISGSGNITLAGLEANGINAQISGLGDLTIEGGSVDALRLQISGSGNFEALELTSRLANVQISGLGSATLTVVDSLDAEISGSGTLRYAGNPAVRENLSGLGKVEKIGD